MTITAQAAIADWQSTRTALVAASGNEALAHLAYDNAKLITAAVASALQTKHTTLKMLRTALQDDIRSMCNILVGIESDMSRAEYAQDRQNGEHHDHPLPGLNKRHEEVTKDREAKKHQLELLEQVLGE